MSFSEDSVSLYISGTNLGPFKRCSRHIWPHLQFSFDCGIFGAFLSCFMILVMNFQQEIILLNILYRTIYLHMCMRGVCIIVHILGFSLKLIFNKSFCCLHKLLIFIIIYITIYNTSTVIIGSVDSI